MYIDNDGNTISMYFLYKILKTILLIITEIEQKYIF